MITIAASVLYSNIKKEACEFVKSVVTSAEIDELPDGRKIVRVRDLMAGTDRGDKFENLKTFVSAYYTDGTDTYKEVVQSSAMFTSDEIKNTSLRVVTSKKDVGKINDCFYAKRTTESGLVLVAVVDKSSEIDILGNFVLRSSGIAVIGTACLTVVVWILSYYVTKPIKDSIQNEKRFISDASHELKTPLTIISANVEVMTDGQPNEWADNIKSQTKRMQKLVEEMLELSKLDESIAVRKKVKHEKFSLSDKTLEVVMPFDPIAYEKHIEFNYEILHNVDIYSDPDDYKKVLGVLVENAVKYTAGKIDINLQKKNKNTYELVVENTGCGIKNADKDRVFERFYRSDASRASSTGGSGLGLAIAKELSEKNGWKLSLECEENVFTKFRLVVKINS